MKFNVFYREVLDFVTGRHEQESERKQETRVQPVLVNEEPKEPAAPQLVRRASEHDILALLERMVELLESAYLNEWAAALEQCGEAVRVDALAGTSSLLSKFGGTDSLDDVRLFRAGALLPQSDTEFAALRAELYTLCHLFNKERLAA